MTTNYNYPPHELEEELIEKTKALIAPGKGILCADESPATMGKRFANINLKNNDERRRHFRQLLFTCSTRLREYISGIVLNHETAVQSTDDGVPFLKLLLTRKFIAGIRVDTGTVPLAGSMNEFTTQGLDNLYDRCAEYKKLGIDFAKWRCIYKIGNHTPSYQAITQNANISARYASICQSQGIVPMIETEILPDGDYDIDLALKVTETILGAVYKALLDHHVFLEGTLLRPSMVKPGINCKSNARPDKIALYTIRALRRTVPLAVPGIFFLSGGQSEEEASINLNAINLEPLGKAWPLSFSFGRALQTSVLRVWGGKMANMDAAQQELIKHAKINSEATLGQYFGGISGPGIKMNYYNANHAFAD